ncbi:ELMO domain-containing protein 3 [Lonchura striata]|uniref:ELMO domain-containing protein 3 n=1 Tax=Lonchura striata TaxID=40157 RepID=A0A218UCL9_9PASE|nr:ELMO domain-containing protein 3 [Lonchura striata domestica]
MRILQTIYRQLTCSRLGCPRYGAHWEELGFQGRTGSSPLPGEIPKIHPNLPWNLPVLSQLPQPLPVLQTQLHWPPLDMLQPLNVLLGPQNCAWIPWIHPVDLWLHGCSVKRPEVPEGRRVFQLSFLNAGILVVSQHFPFCIMSVNITRIVIQALQEERLSRECNRRQQVIGVLNDLYAAAFLRLSRLWEQQHGTVADAGFFLKELELSTKKKPRQLLKSLEAYLSRGLQPPSLPSSQIHFTNICDPGVELEGDS